MPFLITPERAAHKIANKINTNDFEIYFPKRLILGMELKIFSKQIIFQVN